MNSYGTFNLFKTKMVFQQQFYEQQQQPFLMNSFAPFAAPATTTATGLDVNDLFNAHDQTNTPVPAATTMTNGNGGGIGYEQQQQQQYHHQQQHSISVFADGGRQKAQPPQFPSSFYDGVAIPPPPYSVPQLHQQQQQHLLLPISNSPLCASSSCSSSYSSSSSSTFPSSSVAMSTTTAIAASRHHHQQHQQQPHQHPNAADTATMLEQVHTVLSRAKRCELTECPKFVTNSLMYTYILLLFRCRMNSAPCPVARICPLPVTIPPPRIPIIPIVVPQWQQRRQTATPTVVVAN